MTENINQLTFEADAPFEDGWSSRRESYLILAKRSDGIKIRCIVSREALDDHFPNDNRDAPSPPTLEKLKARLQVLAVRERFSPPDDDFRGLDLFLRTVDF